MFYEVAQKTQLVFKIFIDRYDMIDMGLLQNNGISRPAFNRRGHTTISAFTGGM